MNYEVLDRQGAEIIKDRLIQAENNISTMKPIVDASAVRTRTLVLRSVNGATSTQTTNGWTEYIIPDLKWCKYDGMGDFGIYGESIEWADMRTEYHRDSYASKERLNNYEFFIPTARNFSVPESSDTSTLNSVNVGRFLRADFEHASKAGGWGMGTMTFYAMYQFSGSHARDMYQIYYNWDVNNNTDTLKLYRRQFILEDTQRTITPINHNGILYSFDTMNRDVIVDVDGQLTEAVTGGSSIAVGTLTGNTYLPRSNVYTFAYAVDPFVPCRICVSTNGTVYFMPHGDIEAGKRVYGNGVYRING